MDTSTTINYQSSTNSGTKDRFSAELPDDGVVTRLYCEAVIGEAADVRRKWLVKTPERERNILRNVDAEYLAGDGSVFDLKVHEPFTAEDELVLEVDNTDPNNSYPNIAFAEVQYGEVSLLERLAGVSL
jgi:hypothetical protein